MEVLLSQVAMGRALRTQEPGQEPGDPNRTRTLTLAPGALGARPTGQLDSVWVN